MLGNGLLFQVGHRINEVLIFVGFPLDRPKCFPTIGVCFSFAICLAFANASSSFPTSVLGTFGFVLLSFPTTSFGASLSYLFFVSWTPVLSLTVCTPPILCSSSLAFPSPLLALVFIHILLFPFLPPFISLYFVS